MTSLESAMENHFIINSSVHANFIISDPWSHESWSDHEVRIRVNIFYNVLSKQRQ